MIASQLEAERPRIEAFQQKHRIALLTMLFTDIVGSTKLKQVLGEHAALELLGRHDEIIRKTLAQFPEAEEIRTTGDSFFCIFAKPSDATHFALLAQQRVRELVRETGRPVFDRIGIHVGEVFIQERDETRHDLFGLQVDAAARIQSLAGADQILLSRFAFDNARQVLRGQQIAGLSDLSWLNHGYYEMKGVDDPIEICEVGEVGHAALAAPGGAEKARRCHGADGEMVLGWRPASGQRMKDTPWLLERALGEGGFGEVWLARHETLKIRRVIKFCFRAERVRSLRREMTLFRVLRERAGEHPGIVVVHDVVFDTPPFYLVMDFVDGSNLFEWAAKHAPLRDVPLTTRIDIVRQIAEALQVAHDAGVIHRDVKPSNILLTEERRTLRAKLTDFGIGQVTGAGVFDGITRAGFTQTMLSTGTGSGTPLYMAPELLAGRPASPRSDLYSLGVVLFQLLSGDLTAPLTSDWPEQIEDPLLRADIRRCVAGDPEKRFATVGELATQLQRLAERRNEQYQADAAAALAEQKAAMRKKWVFNAIMFAFAVGAGALANWGTADPEMMMLIAVTSAMWFACANVFFEKQLTDSQTATPQRATLSSEILKLMGVFALVGAQTLAVFLMMRLAGTLDGMIQMQCIGLLGMAWSCVALAMAATAVTRSQGGLILVLSALFLPQIFLSGYIVRPTSMKDKRSLYAVSSFTPGFSARTIMDLSFVYNRPLTGPVTEDHYQAIKNLGANDPNNRNQFGIFVQLDQGILAISILSAWGLGGFAVALWARRRQRKHIAVTE